MQPPHRVGLCPAGTANSTDTNILNWFCLVCFLFLRNTHIVHIHIGKEKGWNWWLIEFRVWIFTPFHPNIERSHALTCTRTPVFYAKRIFRQFCQVRFFLQICTFLLYFRRLCFSVCLCVYVGLVGCSISSQSWQMALCYHKTLPSQGEVLLKI